MRKTIVLMGSVLVASQLFTSCGTQQCDIPQQTREEISRLCLERERKQEADFGKLKSILDTLSTCQLNSYHEFYLFTPKEIAHLANSFPPFSPNSDPSMRLLGLASDDVEFMGYLLKRRVKPDKRKKKTGGTTLHAIASIFGSNYGLTIKKRYLQTAELLLKAGAKPNKIKDGSTPTTALDEADSGRTFYKNLSPNIEIEREILEEYKSNGRHFNMKSKEYTLKMMKLLRRHGGKFYWEMKGHPEKLDAYQRDFIKKHPI